MPTADTNGKPDAPTNVELATEAFVEHGDFIRAVIHFHVKNEAEAEDLFQDLFLFLISKPIPEEVQNVKGYLYKVISNMVRDAFRRIEHYQTRIYRYARWHRRTVENSPEDVLIETEEVEKMFALIERHLPRKEALAVTLRYRDNCDTGEVADKMGVEPRSVSRYVSVGLKKIRAVFSQKQGSNYDSRQSQVDM